MEKKTEKEIVNNIKRNCLNNYISKIIFITGMHTKYDISWKYYIIYKITCKDSNIKEGYVGSTQNFKYRETRHKYSCSNEKSDKYGLKLYQFIRAHGHFDNFVMEEIERIKCCNDTEARVKEREWYDTLDSTLNTNRPFVNKDSIEIKNPDLKKRCEICKYSCDTNYSLERHFGTKKHKINFEKKEEQTSSTNINKSNTIHDMIEDEQISSTNLNESNTIHDMKEEMKKMAQSLKEMSKEIADLKQNQKLANLN
jgi:hypothetical protein